MRHFKDVIEQPHVLAALARYLLGKLQRLFGRFGGREKYLPVPGMETHAARSLGTRLTELSWYNLCWSTVRCDWYGS